MVMNIHNKNLYFYRIHNLSMVVAKLFIAVLTPVTLLAQSDINEEQTLDSHQSEFERAYLEFESDIENERSSLRAEAKSLNARSAAVIDELKPLAKISSEMQLSHSIVDVSTENYPETMTNLKDSGADFRAKNAELSQLRQSDFSKEECNALMSFIVTKRLKDDGREDLYHLSHKNDALACLIEHRPVPSGLGQLMISIVGDETEDPIWREYVLQYFYDYYHAKWPVETEVEASDISERILFQRALAAAAFHDDSGIAGTALIVLEELSSDYPEFTPAIINKAARRVALSPDCCVSSRITAVSVLGEQTNNEDIETISRIANDSTAQLALRVAATGRIARWANVNADAQGQLRVLSDSLNDTKAGSRLRQTITQIESQKNLEKLRTDSDGGEQ